MLGGDLGIVPVTAASRFVIVVIHEHATANHDVGNAELVTSAWTDMS